MDVPTPLDPRLKDLAGFAADRKYAYDLIGSDEGMAVQILVPHKQPTGQVFQFAEDQLVILMYPVEERIEACAPFIFALPSTAPGLPSIYKLLAAMNFSSDLARYGVDPEDGEVRCIVVLPFRGILDEATFDLLVTSVREGVERLGEALAEAFITPSPIPTPASGNPLIN